MENKTKDNGIVHVIKITGDKIKLKKLIKSLQGEKEPKIKKALDGTWILRNKKTEELGYFQPKYGIFEDAFGKTKYNLIPDNYEPVILPGTSNLVDIDNLNKILKVDITDTYGIKGISNLKLIEKEDYVFYDFSTKQGNFIPILLKLSKLYESLLFKYSYYSVPANKYEAMKIQNGDIVRWDYGIYL